MIKTFSAITLEQLNEVADWWKEQLFSHPVWLLQGEMGAGKTTLTSALCKSLGISEPASSPTFSLVNEYRTPDGRSIFHFDFYRLKHPAEALDFGVEEYLDSGEICLLEWSEKIENLLPENPAVVEIRKSGPDTREITFRIP